MNAITIDVEDWFHVCGQDVDPAAGSFQRRVRPNIERILRLLAEYEVRATFFVLGSVAEEDPLLVPLIAAQGHEIASHGYSHTPARQLGPEAFRDELRRTGEILERQGGRRPVGFRAPQWSLGEDCRWAFEILREDGYRYDSSMNPLPFVGDRNGPRFPFALGAGPGKLLEIPPMVTPSPMGNLPTGGGWGFRFFPRRWIRGTMNGYTRPGAPAVLYLHPREMEADGPRLALSPLRRFAVYGTRKDAAGVSGTSWRAAPSARWNTWSNRAYLYSSACL
jgi:polysaccharide deacetylase family protein (PEP-CTERM system associated)